MLRWIRDNTAIASVLLSNGSLFHLPEVRAAAALADKVKVTLSAWDEASFQQIHRPAPGVGFEQLIEGERAFRKEFSGELSVEVFSVEGMNSAVSDVGKIAALVETIHPDRIDLNTAVRPPADSGVRAASPEQLAELATVFGSKAEVVASFKKQATSTLEVTPESLISLIQRHPATAPQLAKDYNVPPDSIFQTLETLVKKGTLYAEKLDGETYYFHRA